MVAEVEAQLGRSRAEDAAFALSDDRYRLDVVEGDPGRGWVLWHPGRLAMLGATDEQTAAVLLWRYLAGSEGESLVHGLTAAQQWAFDVLHQARSHGADTRGLICRRHGCPGPLDPFGLVLLTADSGPVQGVDVSGRDVGVRCPPRVPRGLRDLSEGCGQRALRRIVARCDIRLAFARHGRRAKRVVSPTRRVCRRGGSRAVSRPRRPRASRWRPGDDADPGEDVGTRPSGRGRGAPSRARHDPRPRHRHRHRHRHAS